MTKIAGIIHYAVQKFKLDILIARYCSKFDFLIKFIPEHIEYKKGSIKRVTRDNINFALDISDYMQWHIFAGIKEPLWDISFDFIKFGTTVLDIGANVGSFAFKCAAHCQNNNIKAQIIAFEPNPIINQRLKYNKSINYDFKNLILIEDFAISDMNGISGFEFNERNSGYGKLTSTGNGYQVDCMTLDKYVADKNIGAISLIKIDVEGFEPLVIKGGNNTIINNKPLLLVEITDDWYKKLGFSEFELKKKLIDLGYQLFVYENKKLKEISGINTIFAYQYNLLGIPYPL